MQTLAQFIAEHEIRMESVVAEHNPWTLDPADDMTHWRCRLFRSWYVLPKGASEWVQERRQTTVYFSMGSGHEGQEPDVEMVLSALADDCAGFENADSFQEWCSEYGYDPVRGRAHHTFTIIEQLRVRLIRFLGNESYLTLLWETKRG